MYSSCLSKRALIAFVPLYIGFLSTFANATTFELGSEFGKRQILFFSKTSQEGFEGSVIDFSGMVGLDFSKKDLGLKGSIVIPVMGMQTGITMRDVHMRSQDWLFEDRYPSIRFQLAVDEKMKVKKKGKNKWFVEVMGNIQIRGRSKNIKIPVTIKRKESKKGTFIYVKGGFKILLSDFGIRGPLAMRMIGAKVSPEIKISLKLTGKAIN